MIDLHLHLDGSLDEKDFIYLSKKENIPLPDDFPSCIRVPHGCTSLEQYLECFNLPLKFMQSEENLVYITKSLVDRLYSLGYIYAEIRFASQLHTENGLSQVEVIKSVLKGLKEALKGKTNFDCNLILCMMRQAPYEINRETLEAVKEVNDPKIVAVDLAGPEAVHPSIYYKDLFDIAKEYGFNITIHAGEACGNDSVLGAIACGATRIGHGVHLSLDNETVNTVKDRHIYFEFCPTSNLQTTSLPSYEAVPLKGFKEHDIPVCINSDNMTVSWTDVIEEYKHLYQTFHLSKEDVRYYLSNSIEAAFISESQKESLRKLMLDRLDGFYHKVTE